MAAAANYDHGERWNETEYAYAGRKLMWITNKSIVKQKPQCLVGCLVARTRALESQSDAMPGQANVSSIRECY